MRTGIRIQKSSESNRQREEVAGSGKASIQDQREHYSQRIGPAERLAEFELAYYAAPKSKTGSSALILSTHPLSGLCLVASTRYDCQTAGFRDAGIASKRPRVPSQHTGARAEGRVNLLDRLRGHSKRSTRTDTITMSSEQGLRVSMNSEAQTGRGRVQEAQCIRGLRKAKKSMLFLVQAACA